MTEITLAKLREPFAPNQISKLPKPTKSQTEDVKSDFKKGMRCGVCGGWHHKDVIHLDYVGHAALTDRLLDTDPAWSWEPLAIGPDGLPVIDKDGGLWIRLTVLGVSRLGYGDAQGKSGGDAMKERIGDALRNAAMRFGAALELWHKGDLHVPEKEKESTSMDASVDHYLELCERLTESIAEIKIGINKGDLKRSADAWFSLSGEDKEGLWRAPSKGGCFTTEERNIIKSTEFREAHFVTQK